MAPPHPDDVRRLDAYLARARALGAADWGRLDAIGARLGDNTPWARLRLARLDADRVALLEAVIPRSVIVGGAAVVRAATDAGRWLGAQPTPDPFAPPRRRVSRADEPRAPEPSPDARAWQAWRERYLAGVAELRRLAQAAPARGRSAAGGASAAFVLELGFESLWSRAVYHRLDAAATERTHAALGRLYAPVEPVIPLAALDGTQPRLPPATP